MMTAKTRCIILISFLFFSCSDSEQKLDEINEELDKNESESIDSLKGKISLMETEMEMSMMNGDTILFEATWNGLVELDTGVFNYYLDCWKTDSWNNDWSVVLGNTKDLNTNGGMVMLDSYSRMSSLYLLTSLIYDDYFFATIPLLYDTTEIEYIDSLEMVKYAGWVNTTVIGRKHLKRSWEYLNEWYENNRGKNLEELRECGRPLPPDVFWLGEKAGPINREYYLK